MTSQIDMNFWIAKVKLKKEELQKRLFKIQVELLSEYVNFKQKCKFRCLKCEKVFMSTLDSLFQRKNSGCSKCSKIESSLKQKLTLDQVASFFEENGCILLEKKYVNAHRKMKYICLCGHISEINYNNFKNGRRCKGCAVKNISGKNNYGWIEDREEHELRKRTRCFCYSTIKRCLNSNKKKSSYCYLGYQPKDLIKHLKNHKNWGLIKGKKWHIDHIFPLKAFFDHGIYDVKVINRLDNIQPMLSQENMKKNARYSKEDFLEYLKDIEHEFNNEKI